MKLSFIISWLKQNIHERYGNTVGPRYLTYISDADLVLQRLILIISSLFPKNLGFNDKKFFSNKGQKFYFLCKSDFV